MEHSHNHTFQCSSCQKEPTGHINVQRFIARLDRHYASGDLAGAGETLKVWEAEAISLGDDRGLLSVLNEQIGYSRRVDDKDLAMHAIDGALSLIDSLSLSNHVSGATILINAATTYKAFGSADKAMPIYDRAQKIYDAEGMMAKYEYAALLNNKASSLCDLKRYDEAEKCYLSAIDILIAEGAHDGEIAVSYINLAHLTFDRDHTAYAETEALIDKAWEYINSERQPHDANYAFILSKCAPSFRYFKRTAEAEVCEEISREIYGGDRA